MAVGRSGRSITSEDIQRALDQARIKQAADRIQACYERAKLPDLFYCRSITLNFSGAEGFKATMELASYMPEELGAGARPVARVLEPLGLARELAQQRAHDLVDERRAVCGHLEARGQEQPRQQHVQVVGLVGEQRGSDGLHAVLLHQRLAINLAVRIIQVDCFKDKFTV